MKWYHFVQSPYINLFDMNAKSFSETAVQSSFREVVEEGQQYVRMESFEYIF